MSDISDLERRLSEYGRAAALAPSNPNFRFGNVSHELDERWGKITRHPPALPFPTPETPSVTQEVGDTVGGAIFSFMLEDASETDPDTDALIPKVLIRDGEINGELPTGMGADDYEIAVADGDEVYAIITYDEESTAITSRTIGVAGTTPDSVPGTIYVRLGYVFVDGGTLHTHNTQCGDINVEFAYGSKNGVKAVLPVAVYATWQEIS